ncbi:MAG: hypothetical protein PUP93_27050 [Rhizonema sp. NSF051]|nr:hypothetical protein [Rhizonema sp. NSF051]
MSAGHLSNLLIKNHACFETEKNEVYHSGLASTPWQQFDQTGARVKGVNYTTNVICNPLYTIYFTTRNKDRLTVVKGLQNGEELEFILNPLTYELLKNFQLVLIPSVGLGCQNNCQPRIIQGIPRGIPKIIYPKY